MAGSSSSPIELPSRKRARKAINCEPCRTHKLKCNRGRPCSGCVLRGTQHLCYADEPEAPRKLGSIADPILELNQIQRSVAALQGHFRAQKVLRDASPEPEPAISQDVLLQSADSDGFYMGPTYISTHLLNQFEVAESKPSQSQADRKRSDVSTTSEREFISSDLVSLLPSKSTLQALVKMYVESATWIFSYIDEGDIQKKLIRYIEYDDIDDLTLALFFAVSAVALYYTPWPHNILRAFPEPAMATGDRFHSLCITVMEQSHDLCMREPTLDYLELNLLVGHYHASAKLSDSGEQIWELCHRMTGVATALGLHRDPERWDLPVEEIIRRRWAWWNVLTFQRWHCILLGRPPTISNSYFDTQYPMSDLVPPDQPVAGNPFLPYLNFFRFTFLLGDILDDLHQVTPMNQQQIALRDRELVEWQESWPPDLKLDEYGIASALSVTSPEDARRRGVQSMYLIGLFNLVRLILNRPKSIPSPSSGEGAITHEKIAAAAHKLITLHVKATPDYINNSPLTVPGHLSNAPYNIFAACMFYTHQLLSNPFQPGAAHFRSNLSDGISTFGKVREMPIANRCFKILVSLHPPLESEGRDNANLRRERITKLRRVTFPFVGLADVSHIENIYPSEEEDPESPMTAKVEPDYASQAEVFQDNIEE